MENTTTKKNYQLNNNLKKCTMDQKKEEQSKTPTELIIQLNNLIDEMREVETKHRYLALEYKQTLSELLMLEKPKS